jgi:hypothetical protein
MKAYLLVFLLVISASPAWAQEAFAGKGPAPLRVNSFLVEEAFTQEAGVVEHIGAFRFSRQSGTWEYSLTQEWPLFNAKHQLSFTLPFEWEPVATEGATGMGDAEVSYGYQLMADDRSGIFVSPRLGLVLPTGDVERGRGAGAPGVEASLPVSISVSRDVVANWNLGASYTPSARNPQGDEADMVRYELGGSLIWMARPLLGLITGAVWESGDEVDGRGETSRSNRLLVAPGIRGTVNLGRGLQLVPGIMVPIGLGPSDGERAIYLFLSLEHPFQRQ